MPTKVTDAVFIDAWHRTKSPGRVAAELEITERAANQRRRSIEARYGISLETDDAHGRPPKAVGSAMMETRLERQYLDGTVIVFSDAHYWPGFVSPAHRALLELIRELQPAAVIANGDVFDGASLSRFPPAGWDRTPTVVDELCEVKERLFEIEQAACGADLFWTMGNHDIRFERYLAVQAPEMRDMPGVKLSDHLPNWERSWSVLINGHTMVKHRYHNGIHARHNNALKSGLHIVTGHLHALGVTPFTDYRGTRYGVDTGTLADPTGPQFLYGEDSPMNHRSGFAVLTFLGGKLLPPELAEVSDRSVYFRGRVIETGEPAPVKRRARSKPELAPRPSRTASRRVAS